MPSPTVTVPSSGSSLPRRARAPHPPARSRGQRARQWLLRACELTDAQTPSRGARVAHLAALLALPLAALVAAVWVRLAISEADFRVRQIEITAVLYGGLGVWLADRLGKLGWDWPVRLEPPATAAATSRRARLLRWVPSWTGLLSLVLGLVAFAGALDFLMVLAMPDRPLIGRVLLWTGWTLAFFPAWLWLLSIPRRWRRQRAVGGS